MVDENVNEGEIVLNEEFLIVELKVVMIME